MDVKQLCNAFMSHYYAQFNGNRAGLAGLYGADSLLTLTGERVQGAANITAKFQTLPPCQAKPLSCDVQPNPATGGAVIVVNGDLQLANGSCPKFAETFLINPVEGNPGQFYIHNHVYRVQS